MKKVTEQDIQQANQLFAVAAALRNEKRFQEAAPIFLKIYNQFPKDDAAIYGYGNNLYELGKLEEAKEFIRQAIKINAKKPEYWLTLLCVVGKGNDGRELQSLCKDIAARFPEYFPLVENQVILQIENWQLKENIATTERLLKSSNFNEEQKNLISAARGLALYLIGEVVASRELISSFELDKPKSGESENTTDSQLRNYFIYLKRLFAFQETHKEIYAGLTKQEIYVIGDSHILSPAYAKIGDYQFMPKLTLGLKAWHLSDNRQNRFKHSFRIVANTIPDGAMVVFNYGEIDCRFNGGIFTNHLKNPQIDLDENINNLVANYVDYISKQIKRKNLKPIIASVPPPCAEYNIRLCQDEKTLNFYAQISRKFNSALMEQVDARGYQYADFYSQSADQYGWAKPGYHIDFVHLMPDFYVKVIADIIKKLPLPA